MNELEYESWRATRRKGMIVYAISKSAIWMVLITIIKWILTKNVDVLEDLIFFIGLIIAYSASWLANEKRFKEYVEDIK